jgi:hypothetical protein
MKSFRESDLAKKQLLSMLVSLCDLIFAYASKNANLRSTMNGQLAKISYVWVEIVSMIICIILVARFKETTTTIVVTNTSLVGNWTEKSHARPHALWITMILFASIVPCGPLLLQQYVFEHGLGFWDSELAKKKHAWSEYEKTKLEMELGKTSLVCFVNIVIMYY